MGRHEIIRAWKDPAYRASLSDEERAQIPANPAGIIELDDAQLDISGGLRNGVADSANIVCASSICPSHLTCSGTLCEPRKSIELSCFRLA